MGGLMEEGRERGGEEGQRGRERRFTSHHNMSRRSMPRHVMSCHVMSALVPLTLHILIGCQYGVTWRDMMRYYQTRCDVI
jgi:hypothetical protein